MTGRFRAGFRHAPKRTLNVCASHRGPVRERGRQRSGARAVDLGSMAIHARALQRAADLAALAAADMDRAREATEATARPILGPFWLNPF